MTFDEFRQLELNQTSRKKPADIEHQIQCSCICWFRVVHPDLKHMLFAVPNGGRRDKATGAKLKAEGALAGVSDLILLIPKGKYASLCIEMKTTDGIQSESQIVWQKEIETAGSKYVICRSLDDFMSEVNGYLKG